MLWILRVDIFNFPAGLCRKKWSPCRCWVHVFPSYGWSRCGRGKNRKEVDLKTAILTLTTFSFLSKLSDWWQNVLIGLLFIWGKKCYFLFLFLLVTPAAEMPFFLEQRFFWSLLTCLTRCRDKKEFLTRITQNHLLEAGQMSFHCSLDWWLKLFF